MKKTILIFLLLTFFKVVFSQTLSADAGSGFIICPGSSGIIGGSASASGGVPPYIYSWQPTTGLSAANISNPLVTITSNTQYTLTVTDANDDSAQDTITVFVDGIMKYDTGNDASFCLGNTSSVTIGNPINASAGGHTFSWLPTTGLSNPSAPNPSALPNTTTIYTLTVSNGFCTAITGTVKVSVSILTVNLSFRDTTINEGNTITLLASGADSYYWEPQTYFIKYQNTANPDVNPPVTKTYTLIATYADGCLGIDTVRVNVIPNTDLIFYSAFTPNGDGDNDYFYIGNIFKYPDNVLKIYNRYGQVVFTSAGYKNDWDGSFQGAKLPTGTYFYILDTRTDKGKYKGSVSILR